MNDDKFFVRTYDNGTHTIEAPDIMTELCEFDCDCKN